MVSYVGKRNSREAAEVYVWERGKQWPLPLATSVRNFGDCGFEWGYLGRGPAQLAVALLLHALGNARYAESAYLDYLAEHVRDWPREGWKVSQSDIRAWFAAYLARLDWEEWTGRLQRSLDGEEGKPWEEEGGGA